MKIYVFLNYLGSWTSMGFDLLHPRPLRVVDEGSDSVSNV